MLESDPSGAPIVKVIDYGVAKVLAPEAERGAEQTQTGFIGTPAFASPEQFAQSEKRDSIRVLTSIPSASPFGICFLVECHSSGARSKRFVRGKQSRYQLIN